MHIKEILLDLFGTKGPTIRKMRPSDLDEVLRIIRLHDSDDFKAARDAFDASRFDLPEEKTAHFVLLDPDDDHVVGVSGYYAEDAESEGVFWLGWTYVNPFCRGKGWGGALMRFVTHVVRRHGGRKLYLTTSTLPKYDEAVRFYVRHGFVEEGRLLDFYRVGEHQLIMGLDLVVAKRSSAGRPRVEESSPRGELSSARGEGGTEKRDPDRDDGVVFEF